MIPEMTYRTPLHPMGFRYGETLEISGFENLLNDSVFCAEACGHRYHEFGIADHSILLCVPGMEPKDEDLVVSFDGTTPVIYLFRASATEDHDGEKRILADRDKVDAVIAGSFNFYR